MTHRTPYDILKTPYVTEKTQMLLSLCKKESNPSLRKCKRAKYTFVVDKDANKVEIASAVESVFASSQVKVVAVNIIHVKKKPRMIRGKKGYTPGFKKAIVTLQDGQEIISKAQG